MKDLLLGQHHHEPTGLTLDTIFSYEPAHNTWNPTQRTGSRGSAKVWLGIRGGQGAVMLGINSAWYHSTDVTRIRDLRAQGLDPDGIAISYHFYRAVRDYMHRSDSPCGWLQGDAHCYGDISYLASEDAFNVLTDQGLAALFDHLTTAYHDMLKQEDPT